jgi:hypothetical protein
MSQTSSDQNRPYPEGIAFDEAWRQRQKAERLERILSEIVDTLYGKNLQLANWHLNGELEPIDSLFEDNDWFVNSNSPDHKDSSDG